MTEKIIPPSKQDAVPELSQKKVGEIAESGENYLETILLIKSRRDNGLVRAVDVANELKVSKPSVSRGLSLLKDKDLIKIGIAGDIELTQKGREVADSIFKKHQMLTVFFRHIAKVSNDIAKVKSFSSESATVKSGLIAQIAQSLVKASPEEPGQTPKLSKPVHLNTVVSNKVVQINSDNDITQFTAEIAAALKDLLKNNPGGITVLL